MYRLQRQGLCLSADIRIANTYLSRLRGLLFTRPLPQGAGLLLKDCNSIHMFFMTYAIDLAFLDKNMHVVALHKSIRPWRLASCRRASHVLELGMGSIDALDLHVGQQLEFA